MSSAFYKTLDDIQTDILTDYGNLDSAPDITAGSPAWIMASVLASCTWGIYKYVDYLTRQIFVDTADTDNLNHFGSIYGMARLLGESDNDYAGRILTALRKPPAGGTAVDYKVWATSQTYAANINENFLPAAVNTSTYKITVTQPWVDKDPVKLSSTGTLPSDTVGPLSPVATYYVRYVDATHIQLSSSPGGAVIPLTTQGTGLHTLLPQSATKYYAKEATVVVPPTVQVGTVTIVILPAVYGTGSETVPVQVQTTLPARIAAYIDTMRPVTAAANTVIGVTVDYIPITMTVSPITAPVAQITSDITAYVNSLLPGDTLYNSKLVATAVNSGAISVPTISPAGDTVAAVGHVIRPASVVVTAVS